VQQWEFASLYGVQVKLRTEREAKANEADASSKGLIAGGTE